MDKATFTREVHARERSLYRVAVSILHHDQDAADAVQDALLTAWEKRHTLRQPAYFGTWLTRILINRCKQHLRRARPQVALDDRLPASLPDTTEGIALHQALMQLDAAHRIPLLLYHLEGYTVKDISRILMLPQGTVKSRLARARSKLKDLLEEPEVAAHA